MYDTRVIKGISESQAGELKAGFTGIVLTKMFTQFFTI